jgi:hypothetical protein
VSELSDLSLLLSLLPLLSSLLVRLDFRQVYLSKSILLTRLFMPSSPAQDVDEGDSFTYTGSGGTALKEKNLRVGPQIRDQAWDHGPNACLKVCLPFPLLSRFHLGLRRC